MPRSPKVEISETIPVLADVKIEATIRRRDFVLPFLKNAIREAVAKNSDKKLKSEKVAPKAILLEYIATFPKIIPLTTKLNIWTTRGIKRLSALIMYKSIKIKKH